MAKRIIRIVLEVLSLIVLLGTIMFLILYWRHLPDQVPAHYDARGQIDGWGGKGMLFFEPIMMLVLYVTLSLAKTIRFRSLKKEVRAPAPPLMLPAMKLVLLAGLGYMTVCTALARPLGAWFLPVFLTLEFVPLIAFTVYAAKNRLI